MFTSLQDQSHERQREVAIQVFAAMIASGQQPNPSASRAWAYAASFEAEGERRRLETLEGKKT